MSTTTFYSRISHKQLGFRNYDALKAMFYETHDGNADMIEALRKSLYYIALHSVDNISKHVACFFYNNTTIYPSDKQLYRIAFGASEIGYRIEQNHQQNLWGYPKESKSIANEKRISSGESECQDEIPSAASNKRILMNPLVTKELLTREISITTHIVTVDEHILENIRLNNLKELLVTASEREKVLLDREIMILQTRISNSALIRNDSVFASAQLGAVVKYENLATGIVNECRLVGRGDGDISMKRIDITTPFGEAIQGHVSGDTISFQGNDKSRTISVKILGLSANFSEMEEEQIENE